MNVNGELIYGESETPPVVTTDDATRTATNQNAAVGGINNNGGVNSLAANVEINSPNESISQSANNDNGENSVDLTNAKYSRSGSDNEVGNFEENDEVSQRVFDKYLTEGIMTMVRNTVEKEI